MNAEKRWTMGPPSLMLAVSEQDATLLVMVSQLRKVWMVVALEASAHDEIQVQDVLASHCHKLVGERECLPRAMILAEEFADEWRRSHPLSKCECKEI